MLSVARVPQVAQVPPRYAKASRANWARLPAEVLTKAGGTSDTLDTRDTF